MNTPERQQEFYCGNCLRVKRKLSRLENKDGVVYCNYESRNCQDVITLENIAYHIIFDEKYSESLIESEIEKAVMPIVARIKIKLKKRECVSSE